MLRFLVYLMAAGVLLSACGRRAVPERTEREADRSAPAQAAAPDWVGTSGSSARYPGAVYLLGYGLAQGRSGETAEELRARALDIARTNLSERVMVRLKSETEYLQETGRTDQLRVLTETGTQLQLEGLQNDEWFDRRGNAYHVLAYARRDLMQSLYAERADRAYALVRRPYREGQRLVTSQPAEAIKAFRRAERAFGAYEEEDLITRALGRRAAITDDGVDGPARESRITRDSITSRIAELSERPVRTIDDLAFYLALGLHSQLQGTPDTTGTVAIAPITVEGTPFGSALGRHLQSLVERQLTRLGPLRVVTFATLPNGRIRADYVVKGSYGLTESSTVHTTLRRNLADGRGRLVATTDATVPVSLLKSTGLALDAENGAEAKEAFEQTAANQYAPVGGLNLEAWTNRGTESSVVVEGDTVLVYLRTNRSAYVRLLYRLADGRTVLLYDNFRIAQNQVGQVVPIPQAFVATPPFGAELMTIMAADQPFPPLGTRDEDGYRIVRGSLPDAAMSTRGLKPVEGGLTPVQNPNAPPPKLPHGAFAERTIGMTTLPRR